MISKRDEASNFVQWRCSIIFPWCVNIFRTGIRVFRPASGAPVPHCPGASPGIQLLHSRFRARPWPSFTRPMPPVYCRVHGIERTGTKRSTQRGTGRDAGVISLGKGEGRWRGVYCEGIITLVHSN